MSTDLVTRRVGELMASPREHGGERVATLADIARVHGKKLGTVERAFRRQRDKGYLLKGEDFFLAPADQSSVSVRSANGRLSGRSTATVVLSQTGYVLLSKSFDDAQSWAIMRKLVRCYFTVADLVAELHRQNLELAAGMDQARRALAQAAKMAKRAPSHAAAILGLRSHDSAPSPRQTAPAGRTMHDWREAPELREAAAAALAEDPSQFLLPGVSYSLLTDRGGSDLAGLVGRLVADAVSASIPAAIEKAMAARAAGGVT